MSTPVRNPRPMRGARPTFLPSQSLPMNASRTIAAARPTAAVGSANTPFGVCGGTCRCLWLDAMHRTHSWRNPDDERSAGRVCLGDSSTRGVLARLGCAVHDLDIAVDVLVRPADFADVQHFCLNGSMPVLHRTGCSGPRPRKRSMNAAAEAASNSSRRSSLVQAVRMICWPIPGIGVTITPAHWS